MKHMGWTWHEYQATPAAVIDRLIEWLSEQSDDGLSAPERRDLGL